MVRGKSAQVNKYLVIKPILNQHTPLQSFKISRNYFTVFPRLSICTFSSTSTRPNYKLEPRSSAQIELVNLAAEDLFRCL